MIKTIGDEVMVVGADAGRAGRLGGRASRRCNAGSGRCRGSASTAATALYRDGDYYGRAVNLASRVGARAAGGEVLVTRAGGRGGRRAPGVRAIGEVKLKGFTDATELFLARPSAR